MPKFPAAISAWFALSETELLAQRLQALRDSRNRSALMAVVLIALVSLVATDKFPSLIIGSGAIAAFALIGARFTILRKASWLNDAADTEQSQVEWMVAGMTFLLSSYVACLIALGPALAAVAQLTLLGVALLAPLAAMHTVGASRLVFVASAIPVLIGSIVALIKVPDLQLGVVAAFVVAIAIIADHCRRGLLDISHSMRSRTRERSLMSQQLALFSTSQLGIAQTVGARLGRANGRFRQWFGEGSGDALLADMAASIGLSRDRLLRLINRVDQRVSGHDSRTVSILLNGSTPRYFSVQVRRFDPNHRDRGLLWTVSDQTSDWLRRQANERAATRDPLTGALNRRAVHKRMSAMLARDLRRQPFAVLCIDINRFGELNSANGEGFGDQILCIVTRRLQRALRDQDVIARTGGNEFLLVLEGINGMERATKIAEKIMETLSAPIVLTSMTCSIAAAVGIAVAPIHGRRTDEILGHARASMFAVKRTLVQVQAGRLGRRS